MAKMIATAVITIAFVDEFAALSCSK